jgi:hypothetical protein
MFISDLTYLQDLIEMTNYIITQEPSLAYHILNSLYIETESRGPEYWALTLQCCSREGQSTWLLHCVLLSFVTRVTPILVPGFLSRHSRTPPQS